MVLLKRLLFVIVLLVVILLEIVQLTKRQKPVEVVSEATSSAIVVAGEVATVVFVIDGDTIELTDGRRVRYIGIDAPEVTHERKLAECYGQESREENERRVKGKSVRLEKDMSDKDSYGRLLRYVYVGDVFINEELVKEGFARAWSVPPDEKYKNTLFTSQQESKNATLGLWEACKK